jgi:hypothetical protein
MVAAPLVTTTWLQDHLADPDLRIVEVCFALDFPSGQFGKVVEEALPERLPYGEGNRQALEMRMIAGRRRQPGGHAVALNERVTNRGHGLVLYHSSVVFMAADEATEIKALLRATGLR